MVCKQVCYDAFVLLEMVLLLPVSYTAITHHLCINSFTLCSTHILTTYSLGGLDEAFVIVRDLAVEAGAPEGIEFLHSRASENTILLGLPGTKAAIDAGTFPPPPPPLWIPKETKIVDKTDRSK